MCTLLKHWAVTLENRIIHGGSRAARCCKSSLRKYTRHSSPLWQLARPPNPSQLRGRAVCSRGGWTLGSPMRQTMVGTHLEVNGLPACLATLGSDLRSPPAGIDGLKAWHEAATASTTASRCSMCSSTERPECRFANRHSVAFTLTITVGHAVDRFPPPEF